MKNNEFQKMCEKAGIKKEALADTVFTRQFKGIDKESKSLDRLDRYKMNEKDFNLWLEYLATHPRKPDYISFKKFKEKRGILVK
jgi:hypothetical protein